MVEHTDLGENTLKTMNVCARIRPMNETEIAKGFGCAIEQNDKSITHIGRK
jgi:hypothetical protein